MADYATGYGTNIGQSVVDYGLGKAKDSVPGNTSAYPAYYGSQMKAPTQMGYYGYTQNQNPYTAQDFSSVSAALKSSAGDAYSRALTEGDNRYGGRGLYGSQGTGLQSDYMGQAQKAYTQGLLNADATASKLADESNQFAWKSGMADSQLANEYAANKLNWDYSQAQNQNEFFNTQLQNQYNYDLAKRTDQRAQDQQMYENYLALATGASPNAASTLNAATSSANNAAAVRAANNSSLYSGLGGLLGGVLSSGTGGGTSIGGSLYNSAASGLSSLWDSIWG